MQYKNFYKRKILNAEQLQSAWDLYNNLPVNYAQQDYSLFYVEKLNVDSKNKKENAATVSIDRYMKDRYGYTNQTHYFLKYVPYSWTRVHTDNVSRVTKTVITLIEEKDLIGGETLVWDKHYDLPAIEGSYIQRTGSVHRKSEIPCTPKLKPGESLIYDNATRHGVSQVEQGHRIVLVSWYV
jgi:predicted 2-oxoglutarate/Fe(II)-dependent dioxygenase YbiX